MPGNTVAQSFCFCCSASLMLSAAQSLATRATTVCAPATIRSRDCVSLLIRTGLPDGGAAGAGAAIPPEPANAPPNDIGTIAGRHSGNSDVDAQSMLPAIAT